MEVKTVCHETNRRVVHLITYILNIWPYRSETIIGDGIYGDVEYDPLINCENDILFGRSL